MLSDPQEREEETEHRDRDSERIEDAAPHAWGSSCSARFSGKGKLACEDGYLLQTRLPGPDDGQELRWGRTRCSTTGVLAASPVMARKKLEASSESVWGSNGHRITLGG